MTTPTFEDRVMDAIVQRFFEPVTTYNQVVVYDPATGQNRTHWDPQQSSAPLQRVAQEIFTSKKAEITEALLERITLDQIVDAIVPLVVKNVVERLTSNDAYSSWDKPGAAARKKMQDAVWEKVSSEFGKQAVAYLQRTGGLTPVLTATVED